MGFTQKKATTCRLRCADSWSSENFGGESSRNFNTPPEVHAQKEALTYLGCPRGETRSEVLFLPFDKFRGAEWRRKVFQVCSLTECDGDARQSPRNRCAHHLPLVLFGGERMETLEEDFPVTSQQMTDRRPGDSISAASDANGRLSEQPLGRQRVHHVTKGHAGAASA